MSERISLEAVGRKLAGLEAKRDAAIQQAAGCRTRLSAAEERLTTAEEAREAVLAIGRTIQSAIHRELSTVVTRCLEAVYGDKAYEFEVIFEERRGQTEARMVFRREGLEVDPLTESGGGMVDVASFALRIACLVLSSPQRRKLLLLDEPFRFVDRVHVKNVAALIRSLSEELGVQMLLVTHLPDLAAAGQVMEIGG